MVSSNKHKTPIKICIVSLPRTGTTSACLHLLDQGFAVAHTVFSEDALVQAEVVADSPVFIDYPHYPQRFENVTFVYLQRPMEAWLLSIRRLLRSMRKALARDKGVFTEPVLRSFKTVFPGFETLAEYSDDYLVECYTQHRAAVEAFVNEYGITLLKLDINAANAGTLLTDFCKRESGRKIILEEELPAGLPHVNRGRRITYWDSVEHVNKIL